MFHTGCWYFFFNPAGPFSLFHTKSHEIRSAPCHCTSEGLERVHFNCLFADFRQIHFQLWTDVILLQAFADFKYFICDAFWSRPWGQREGLWTYDELSDTLW